MMVCAEKKEKVDSVNNAAPVVRMLRRHRKVLKEKADRRVSVARVDSVVMQHRLAMVEIRKHLSIRILISDVTITSREVPPMAGFHV